MSDQTAKLAIRICEKLNPGKWTSSNLDDVISIIEDSELEKHKKLSKLKFQIECIYKQIQTGQY